MSFDAARAVRAKRFACTSALSFVLVLVSLVMAASALSRDKAPVVRTTDPEVSLPSVTPDLGVTPTATRTAGVCAATSLSVPKINVSARVLALGIDKEGDVLTQKLPDNPFDVSWYKDGSLPGQPGNAVFTGHTWSQGDGVFDRLSELKQGDIVVVHGKGCELTFQVATVQRHVPVNLSSTQVDKLYATDGPSDIVLITCGDYSGGEYRSKIVVHAHLFE